MFVDLPLWTDTYFYMTYNSSFLSHLIRATLFWKNHATSPRNFQKLAISQECLVRFAWNFVNIFFYMAYYSSFESHLIQATFLLKKSRNLSKKWYKMFVYHLTKNLFMMKWSPSKGASMCKVSSNSETKNFSAQKTPKLVDIKKVME